MFSVILPPQLFFDLVSRLTPEEVRQLERAAPPPADPFRASPLEAHEHMVKASEWLIGWRARKCGGGVG